MHQYWHHQRQYQRPYQQLGKRLHWLHESDVILWFFAESQPCEWMPVTSVPGFRWLYLKQ